MRNLLLFITCVCLGYNVCAQHPPQSDIINELPDFIPPSPEASALLKADNLSVGYSTGSPNINIPLFNFRAGNYTLPITLNYSSTGVKVDEYASMVGMGWSLNYGGVISRTVFDKPDGDKNFDPGSLDPNLDITVYNSTSYDFLTGTSDKELDIFTFSFPGYSGKFIIGLNNQPVQLTRNNLKIQIINNWYENGFIILADDGTAYHFEEKEISQTRHPVGTNCEKSFENNFPITTSWYLSKIILPSTNKTINFTYITVNNVWFRSSITQTVNKVNWSGPSSCQSNYNGYVCDVGSGKFSICVSRQKVDAKYISKIESSDGDQVNFMYDSRSDQENAKKLIGMKVYNRNGTIVSDIAFANTQINSTSVNYQYNTWSETYDTKRLFLMGISIRGGEIYSAASPLEYSFSYHNNALLPPRLSPGQDLYGYYNGKNNNPSLIPILQSNDPNYYQFTLSGVYGAGCSLVTFGDRSIDNNYSKNGLLTKITYPTGGYDEIEYEPNKVLKFGNEVDAGGHSVSKIKSYTFNGNKVLERQFIYRDRMTNTLSSFLLTNNLIFSQVNIVKTSGEGSGSCTCESNEYCHYGIVTSNANNPITTFGSQHLYHKTVQEKVINGTDDNGIIEHKYSYAFEGLLPSVNRMGNPILNAPYQVVPDILKGEEFTNVYKKTGSTYSLVKSTERQMEVEDQIKYSSFVVKRNWEYICYSSNPTSVHFSGLDVDQVYINSYTVRTKKIIEKDYMDNGVVITKITDMEYDPDYTYPKIIKTTGSDLVESRIERKYPPDISSTITNKMVARNIISPVIEEKQFKGVSSNDPIVTKTQDWKDWFNDDKVLAPMFIDLKTYNNSLTQKVKFGKYDVNNNASDGYDDAGNALQIFKEGDHTISYIWDYSKSFPIAKVQNAEKNEIAYTSFEADGEGSGWSLSGTVLNQGGITGRKSFNGTASKTNLPTGNYTITAWSFSTSGLTVNSSSGNLLRTLGDWKLYEWTLNNVSTVSVSGTNYDELRLYPKDVLMTTFTYVPLVGVTAQIDPNNRITYFEYDGMSRLALIRDEEKNIIKKICYNYAGHIETCNVYYNSETNRSIARNNCSPGYTGTSVTYTVPAERYSGYTQADANAKAEREIDRYGQDYANQNGSCLYNYYNVVKNGTFTKNNCPPNYTGSQVTYTVPANTYSSTISQQDADNQAQADVNANGQTYANTNGTCTPNCNTSTCTANGPAYKCVYGQCEQGIKVYTNSQYISPHYYICTYHYEWSDGSWSQNYTEESVTHCMIAY